MTDAPDPTEHPADAAANDEEAVEVADVSGGAVPEQLLEDSENDGPSEG